MHKLDGLTNRVVPRQTLDVIKEDPSDNRILECAVEAGSEYVVTWDKRICSGLENLPGFVFTRRICCDLA